MSHNIASLARKLRARKAADIAALLEAWLTLTTAFALVRCVAFRKWSRYLGTMEAEAPSEDLPQSRDAIARVQWAVRAARRFVPWNSTCLMDAVAGKLMLSRRRIGSTLYLGVRSEPSKAEMSLDAHAWLRAGNVILTGDQGRHRFPVVAKFTTR
jgi:hypothetical protein